MQAEVEIRIIQAHNRLKATTDDELNNKIREGLRYCDTKDVSKDKIGNWDIICASLIFYEGVASQRILQERHGLEYIQNVLGYKKPKTLIEKVNYYLTGELPRV